ncbi:hypothetical protein IBE11_08160 [Francisella tularensis subsp. novicida]|uniref:hypothetical protein n=2 Tax=Francisella tularensis TaxID=263 RepID=UPI000158B0D2|nr:hypothetical protein [Francisella tularensis]AJI45921.1 hypothetical protein AS84_1762 [Francisella tularensis subsp. novicida F6168]AJJ47440.1 hypothetical protein CH70_1265 [Francisella tularensis subsp. novicida]APC98618.1 hypothetical protein KX03_796 [Francisella tularensis subsp. novicida]EDN36117.1 conserved hypothetical protein [Francisella tularensis subsp. novicida GA99-3549]KFJ66917.1 hypothetical protein DR83_1159 [Francisella tularensis subsp. novicida]
MKKKIIISTIIISIIIVISGIGYYFHYQTVQEELAEQAQEEAALPKPTDYCLITYQQSTDNGKTWQKVNVINGQKPMFKAQCWKRYIQILDGFAASTDTDGKWYSKTEDGKIIAHPAMYFADKPFDIQDKAPVVQQSTQNNTNAQPQN